MHSQRNASIEGAAMAYLLLCTVFLFAIVGGVTEISVLELRASADYNRRQQSFYLADSGAQVGNFLLRETGTGMGYVSFVERFAGGSAEVEITPLDFRLYRITSIATLQSQQTTVELYVQFESSFALDGAMELALGDGVEMRGEEILVHLQQTSQISGMDHSDSGELLEDQTQSVFGLAMNPLAGDVDFTTELFPNATLEGDPEATTNEAVDKTALLEALRDEALNNADVRVDGSVTLNNSSTGQYGTAEDPKLVYVRLDQDQSVQMSQNFVGYGTLVIDAERSESDDSTTLLMRDSTEWHGMVMVYYRGRVRVQDGQPLIQLDNFAKLIGGLVVFANGDRFRMDEPTVLLLTANASILYSSEWVSSGPGMDTLEGNEQTARLVSYILR